MKIASWGISQKWYRGILPTYQGTGSKLRDDWNFSSEGSGGGSRCWMALTLPDMRTAARFWLPSSFIDRLSLWNGLSLGLNGTTWENNKYWQIVEALTESKWVCDRFETFLNRISNLSHVDGSVAICHRWCGKGELNRNWTLELGKGARMSQGGGDHKSRTFKNTCSCVRCSSFRSAGAAHPIGQNASQISSPWL